MIRMPGYSYGGHDAYDDVPDIVGPFGKKVCIIGGKRALAAAMPILQPVLDRGGFTVTDTILFGDESSRERGEELAAMPAVQEADVLFAVGGGKAMDTVKMTVACFDFKPFFTFPTIAATCAAISRVAAVYSPTHEMVGGHYNKRAAEHCFIDGDIIAASPTRYFKGGIGDTIAKYYESTFSAEGYDCSYEEEWGLTMSELCAKPLIAHGVEAVKAAESNVRNEAFDRVVTSIIVTTGYVSGLLPLALNTSIAHALAYGLIMNPRIEEDFLHGEEVGYGTLVMLTLIGKEKDYKEVRHTFERIGIPVSLKDFGLAIDELDVILDKALAVGDMDVSPYPITKDMLLDAIQKVG